MNRGGTCLRGPRARKRSGTRGCELGAPGSDHLLGSPSWLVARMRALLPASETRAKRGPDPHLWQSCIGRVDPRGWGSPGRCLTAVPSPRAGVDLGAQPPFLTQNAAPHTFGRLPPAGPCFCAQIMARSLGNCYWNGVPMLARTSSTCPGCASLIEPGQSIRAWHPLGWFHRRCWDAFLSERLGPVTANRAARAALRRPRVR